MSVKNMMRAFFLMVSVVFATSVSFGYDVWLGLPYFPKGADTTLKDQWELTAPMLDGVNPNLSQSKLPVEERLTVTEWKQVFKLMPTAKNQGMAPLPRTHFNYGTRTDKGTLPELLVKTFNNESKYGYKIKWVMPYDEQPNEDRTLPVYHWSDAELQEMRDWLDNNGHADTQMMLNIRNNGEAGHLFLQKPLIAGYSIEARAKLWFENTGNRPLFLQWALSDPLVKDKKAKFQMPFGAYNDTQGLAGTPSNMDGYQAMRRCMRWLVTDVLGGSTDLFRRDDTTFLSIVYDPGVHFPEKTDDGTEYVDSVCSVLLSIMEQKALFDGTAPGGLITVEQCMSYERAVVESGPTEGLVAHWPLDEGTGTNAGDASGYGFDGELLNGTTWGHDAERGTYAVFDGTDDRIATTYKYALTDTDDFTWTWWAKMEPTSHSGSIMVGNRYGNTGSETYEFIKMTPSKGAFANTDSTGNIENYDYADIAASSWHHYAMVKTGTSYQWYVDGVAQGAPVTINYNETSPLPFLIGGDGDNKPNEHFEGCIDDVVLYREALTPPEIADVINGIYLPVIPMVVLGSPVWLTDGSTWQDGLPAHSGAGYVVPDTGNLKSPDGSSLFPGYSLTVEGGGKFQFRAKHELGETTTVNNLIATGGTSGKSVNLAAGTGNNTVNHLDGALQNDGFTKLSGYGSSSGPRNIRLSSKVSGSGTLYSTGSSAYPHTCTVVNAANTFSGVWESNIGTLVFESAGAVGAADITVLSQGKLRITDDWVSTRTLTVADSATATVDLGFNDWTVSNLVFGVSTVPEGTYTTAELNGFGANAVFTGTGTLRVGEPLPPPVYELIAGWDTWDSPTAPAASVLVPHVTGTAVTTTEQQAWNVIDERGASNDGDWGTFATIPSASTVTNADNENLTLNNAASGGTITFTVMNNGTDDIDLGGFYFDAYAFRPKAPRTYELSILAGSGISTGVVFTSAADAIPDVGGAWDNGAHDDIDIDLTGLPDNKLGAGESVSFLLAFSGGAGDGSGGHHLFVDNVGITGAFPPVTKPPASPVLEHDMNGSDIVFSWTGNGFKVQSRTNLTAGTWQDVPGGNVPPVTNSTTGPEAFFRLIEQ